MNTEIMSLQDERGRVGSDRCPACGDERTGNKKTETSAGKPRFAKRFKQLMPRSKSGRFQNELIERHVAALAPGRHDRLIDAVVDLLAHKTARAIGETHVHATVVS